MFQLGADVGVGPEAQGGDYLLALGAVEEIQRDDAGGDRTDEPEEFAKT